MMPGEAAERGLAGTTRVYLSQVRDQLFLLQVSMREGLEEGHLAWFVLDVVAAMDTAGLHRRLGAGPGRPPYEPEMMVALLLYAYCGGVRSSRRIEAACRTDAAYRVICGGLVPDHATIARFVVEHERMLEGLFVEGVRLCAVAGLADLSMLALDGTKIAADAALARNRDADWIRREIDKLMAATAQEEEPSTADAQLRAGAPVAGLGSPTGRHARLRAALAVIEAEDAAAAADAEQQASRAAEHARRGRQVTGRKPKNDPRAALARAEIDHSIASERLDGMRAARAANQTAAAAAGRTATGPPYPSEIERAAHALARADTAVQAAHVAVRDAPGAAGRANITDPDSRIMSTKDGWVQGYNAQAIVNQHQIVLACEVSQNAGDVQLYEPMNDRLTRRSPPLGSPPGSSLSSPTPATAQSTTSPAPARTG